MTLREQFICVASAFALASKGRKTGETQSLKSVSTRIFRDGKTVPRVFAGGDITTGSYERAMEWFSTNWPEGAYWPEGIARPQPREGEAA